MIGVKQKQKIGEKIRKWHKWGGLFFSFFLLMFCFSGLLLNHRYALSSIDLSRNLLPSAYHYNHWNLGAIKGGVKLDSSQVLLYGSNGIWKTDLHGQFFSNYTKGMKQGADNKYISNLVKTRSEKWFACTTFNVYLLNKYQEEWICLNSNLPIRERLTDIATQGDSVIVQTRSALYIAKPPYKKFQKIYLQPTIEYKPYVKAFRTLWTLHSGELFGELGKLFVDFLGLVTIILCLTGLVLSFFPNWIYKTKKRGLKSIFKQKILQKASIIHNKGGAYLLSFLIILTLTGTFLRPPLLITIIKTIHSPIPFTTQDTPNAWFDKLRTLRYDSINRHWLFYTSEGFYKFKTLKDIPTKIHKSPPVGFMGPNVLLQINKNEWIVGSFAGLYKWNVSKGLSYNLYTKKIYKEPKHMSMPDFSNSVSGYCNVIKGEPIIFDYNRGAENINKKTIFVNMPNTVSQGKISLWHTALEVHVGRIYTFLPKIVLDLFIFLAGLFVLSVLISGYIVYKKHFSKKTRIRK